MQNDTRTAVTAYDILGVPYNADQKDIHASLRKLALDWHPDRVPSYKRGEATLRFQSLMDAYAKIRTPEHRAAYNQSLKISGTRAVKKKLAANSNDNLALGVRARAWLRAIETVFWPVRKEK